MSESSVSSRRIAFASFASSVLGAASLVLLFTLDPIRVLSSLRLWGALTGVCATAACLAAILALRYERRWLGAGLYLVALFSLPIIALSFFCVLGFEDF